MKVLSIDDNEEITEMLNDVLIPLGFDFHYVNSGKDGLKKIQESEWDAVFLDLAMPNFSGRDVLKELGKMGDLKKQPIILFTASTISDSEIEELKKLGVKKCLRKPAKLETVVKTLEEIREK